MDRFRPASFVTLLSMVSILVTRPVAAAAQSHPSTQAAPLRGGIGLGRSSGLSRTVHNVFGTIVSFTNLQTNFVLRTRTGHLILVDAAKAATSGAYSAPLFVGKLVVVNGNYDARHVLYATAVSSMTHLDAGTPPDT
jgi:hypothetical protein